MEAQENYNILKKIWKFIINFDKKDDKNKLKELFNDPEIKENIKENIKRNMIKKPF